MRLIIIRHGQSVINITRDWASLPSLDTELTELGHQQATALRDWLQEQQITADVLYTSTMRRTLQTADYVAEALGLEPIRDDRIREVGSNYTNGDPVQFDGLEMTFDAPPGYKAPLQARSSNLPESESWMHFRLRVSLFLDEMVANHFGKTVYVVAHGGVLTATFEHLFNTGPNRIVTADTKNTGWSEFRYEKERDGFNLWAIRFHNRIDHLSKLQDS